MYFKKIISVHYDTRDYTSHVIILCQILTLISTFALSSDNTVFLEHLNFIYHLLIYVLLFCILVFYVFKIS